MTGPHRTRARIALDFDFDTAKARGRFPDVEMSGEPPIDGIEAYVDAMAYEAAMWLGEALDNRIDGDHTVHFCAVVNPPESEEF